MDGVLPNPLLLHWFASCLPGFLYKHLKSKAKNSYEKMEYLNQWLVSQYLAPIILHIDSQGNKDHIFLSKIILKAQNETSLNANWLVL